MSQKQFRSIKGTHDILPVDSWKWKNFNRLVHGFMANYGYKEIRTPAFEETKLFTRSVGEDSDIVSKEMYSWIDQGGVDLTLKPEATASVARAFIQNNLSAITSNTKVYYLDALFRRDRPQKGRWRQFHQFGVEAFGSSYPEQDAEIILMAFKFFKKIGLSDLTLKLNSIGYDECRGSYRVALKDYLKPYILDLSEVSQKRLQTNPLRILDTKISHEKKILIDAPRIIDFLSTEDLDHFEAVKEILNNNNISYELDSHMVRGLDYYTRTTFEITSSALGAQNALCGGGRYDRLVERLGGKSTPAVGFAAGIERIMLALESVKTNWEQGRSSVYVVCLDEESRFVGTMIAEELRSKDISTEIDLLRRSLRSQMREANRIGVRLALLIGERELKSEKIQVKDFRDGSQSEIDRESLIDYIVSLNL